MGKDRLIQLGLNVSITGFATPPSATESTTYYI
nr:MAG TPA: hypothetical protein [Caudoviricetes sp.]